MIYIKVRSERHSICDVCVKWSVVGFKPIESNRSQQGPLVALFVDISLQAVVGNEILVLSKIIKYVIFLEIYDDFQQ